MGHTACAVKLSPILRQPGRQSDGAAQQLARVREMTDHSRRMIYDPVWLRDQIINVFDLVAQVIETSRNCVRQLSSSSSTL